MCIFIDSFMLSVFTDMMRLLLSLSVCVCLLLCFMFSQTKATINKLKERFQDTAKDNQDIFKKKTERLEKLKEKGEFQPQRGWRN